MIEMTEARARAILHEGNDLAQWIADQPWQALDDGSWAVETVHAGWRLRVEPVRGPALLIVAQAPKRGPITCWLIDGGG